MEYIVDGKQMKKIDDRTVQDIGLPALVLMERAALSIADAAKKMFSGHPDLAKGPRILALYGCGGNGADAVAAARILHQSGYPVELCAAMPEQQNADITDKQLELARKYGVKLLDVSPDTICFEDYALVMDGIFGVGLSRPVSEAYASLFKRIAGKVPVLAIDIPSGVSADTGQILGGCITADCTVTFGWRKVGQLLYPGAGMCGKVILADIGFPEFLREEEAKACSYCTWGEEEPAVLPEREADSHKGTYGNVLVWAGSDEMTGAAYLASKAAYRSGVGLVKLLSHPECIRITRGMFPELLTKCLNEDAKEPVKKESVWEDIRQTCDWADVVLAGPGLSQQHMTAMYLKWLCEYTKKENRKLVLDADALNLLAAGLSGKTPQERVQELNGLLPGQAVLTPHPKELARLLGMSVTDITNHWTEIAGICGESDLVWVLKSARTMVVYRNECYINTSGCDGMATGGSGDVLAGFLSGLAVSMEPFEAAKAAVYLHGIAGERAAAKRSNRSMLAGDMLDELNF